MQMTSDLCRANPNAGHIRARRLWLPWRPRLRLIFAYPRSWHYVVVRLGRFDAWVSERFAGWPRPIVLAIFLPPFVIARFLGLVAVFEITIFAFAASIYLVFAEWLLLMLAFPFALGARLAHALPWQLIARTDSSSWTTRVTGWRASQQGTTRAAAALSTGAQLTTPPWTPARHAPRIWM